jgi:NodT family efflux transporter outer membrane factor (OMF) lipoprotein
LILPLNFHIQLAYLRTSITIIFYPVLISACAIQPDYQRPLLAIQESWSNQDQTQRTTPLKSETWWKALNDPVVDSLIEAAQADNPTLEQTIARVDEARANLEISSAQKQPSLSNNSSIVRARSLSAGNTSGPSPTQTTTSSTGVSFNWELDLFGRIRNSVEISKRRLDARTADTQSVRLSIASEVGTNVLALRACQFSVGVLAKELQSRDRVLSLTRLRLNAGYIAPSDEAKALTSIANARTNFISRREECTKYVNALVALSGIEKNRINVLVAKPLEVNTNHEQQAYADSIMPVAPQSKLAIPALVLLAHPNVVSSEQELAAAWAEIAVSKAERLPRINLAAILTGQWLRAVGETIDYNTWSIGPSLTAPLYDGGRGSSSVKASQARYQLAVADLNLSLRSAAQDIENALAAIDSAKLRISTTQESVEAAMQSLIATEAQWRAGSISMFELEDARREHSFAQDSAINALRDSGQAWIALVRASGNSVITLENTAP